MREFGFTNPVLIDDENDGMAEVPCIELIASRVGHSAGRPATARGGTMARRGNGKQTPSAEPGATEPAAADLAAAPDASAAIEAARAAIDLALEEGRFAESRER
jgi:hypothetical protein